MKIFFASLLLALSVYQPSFASDHCLDLSGTYKDLEIESRHGFRIKQNQCKSLEGFWGKSRVLHLEMDGRPLYNKQLDKVTTSRWISNTLSYVEYEDVSRYGYSKYTKSNLEIEGNTLKWSYHEFKNGKLIGQGSSYSKRIEKGGY